MRKAIKNFFVPCEENNFLPGVLSLNVSLVLIVLAVVFLVSPAAYRYRQAALIAGSKGYSSEEIVALANADRVSVGLKELQINSVLNAAAEAKVQDMFSKNYFSHVSPDSKTPWDFFKGVGYKYFAAGENLAIDFATAEEVNRGLMNSPTHRANILNKLYTEIGVAVGYGVFDGRETILVAQYFGSPRSPRLGEAVRPKIDEVKTPVVSPVKTQPTTTTAKTAGEVVGQVKKEADKLAEKLSDLGPGVLGDSNMSQELFTKINEDVLQAIAVFVKKEILTRLFSAFAMLITTIGVAFMLMRGVKMGAPTILRAMILLLAFGYVLFIGAGSTVLAKVSPISFSTISIEQGK